MDVNNNDRRFENGHELEHEQDDTSTSAAQFPLPTISTLSSLSNSSGSRCGSQDSAGIASHVHPPTPDMDGSADGHRRRRGLLADEDDNDGFDGKARRNYPSQRLRKGSRSRNPGVESKHGAYPSDEEYVSDFSSRSTSDDVELQHIASEDGLTDDEETGLTRKDKRNRRRRKKKNTLLDQRIVGTGKTSRQDGNSADKNVLRASLINALLIASWFRPRSDSISNPHDHSHVRRDSAQAEKPLMTRMFYITRIGPCGIATGLDIGLGNMSLKTITLTFFTMCKSSSLAFVLLFAFLFRLETPSLKLILIIAAMTVGVVMMVAGETEFNALGFVLIISSAFSSGFRWALTQILLLRNPATSNPFSSIFFLAPIMFLTLTIIAIPVEGFVSLAKGLRDLTVDKGAVEGIGILLFPGVLAFLMTTSEFALLKRTSVVTLSICGIFKEVVTITAAGVIFHDPLTPINVSGLMVTIASIGAYNYIKITKMREDARIETTHAASEDGEATEPILPRTEAPNGNREASKERVTTALSRPKSGVRDSRPD
ncbi:Triose-phosphate Transporter [Lobaria immixta]|nr:Triose-phosphate Transporter [Lobaria immixta]